MTGHCLIFVWLYFAGKSIVNNMYRINQSLEIIFKTRAQDCVCYNHSCYYYYGCGQVIIPLVKNNH